MREIIESIDARGKGVQDSLERIVVLGLGGCGCNTVAHLANYGLKGPKLIAANSDTQALDNCPAPHKIILGPKLARGAGCGGKPEMGAKAAEESKEAIMEAVQGAKIVFLTAGMGGGTGTGAITVIAKFLSELPSPPLRVGVIYLPFSSERRRLKLGKEVLAELSRTCQSVIPVYSDRLAKCFPKAPTIECLGLADDILLRAVTSVTDVIQYNGYVNVDMEDVCTVLGHEGQAIMGIGEASGEDRVAKAIEMAVNSPLMADASVAGAKAVLVNIISDDGILMSETNDINNKISEAVSEDCEYFWGMAVDNSLKESGLVKVTVIATGLEMDESLKPAERIVVDLEPEPQVIMGPEPILVPAPVMMEAELEPEAEPKQIVKRRVIKLGDPGLKQRLTLDGLRDEDSEYKRRRQD